MHLHLAAVLQTVDMQVSTAMHKLNCEIRPDSVWADALHPPQGALLCTANLEKKELLMTKHSTAQTYCTQALPADLPSCGALADRPFPPKTLLCTADLHKTPHGKA